MSDGWEPKYVRVEAHDGGLEDFEVMVKECNKKPYPAWSCPVGRCARCVENDAREAKADASIAHYARLAMSRAH